MNSKRSDAIVIAYVPVPHAGYLKFFRAYEGGRLYVLGKEFISEFKPLVRNLPGVTPNEAQSMIKTLGIFSDVNIFTKKDLYTVQQSNLIVMPDEDVSRAIAEKYLTDISVMFDGGWRLRWDWGSTQAKCRPEGERIISTKEFDRYLMKIALGAAERSPDWWRQIGALLVKDGDVLLVNHNQHMPNDQSAYCFGDPRSNFEQGQCIDASVALHAEMGILSGAARLGIKMMDCDLFVSTFPCPPCAYALSQSGIKRLFYMDGYSLVAGAEALKSKGVEIIRVEM